MLNLLRFRGYSRSRVFKSPFFISASLLRPGRFAASFLLTTGLFFLVFFSFSGMTNAYTLPDTGQSKCYHDVVGEIPCPSPGQPFYGQDGNYQAAQPACQDNGDGTVTDLNTGLMWQQGDEQNNSYSGSFKWQEAVDYCEALDLGSHSDWRLPTIGEFQSLIDFGRTGPAINTDYFPGCVSGPGQYWSSTARAELSWTNQSWNIWFYYVLRPTIFDLNSSK